MLNASLPAAVLTALLWVVVGGGLGLAAGAGANPLESAIAQASPPAPRPAKAQAPLRLHVPSPDWRDQVLYFAVTDRFADGNPANNDQGAGEFDPRNPSRYSGGDLEGLRQRLAYIQGLGATALWITPPVANQWLNAQASYSGYHGYWTQDFTRVDPHLGTLQDYRRLSDSLHRRGMYLVQDIVVNHVGDYFFYGPDRDPANPAKGWQANDKGRPTAAPTQFPFSLNDPRRARDRAAAIYHWTPDVADYQDRQQELTHQMSGLDDLNTRNPRVREALRHSYAHWIREVGVDAFRVDTAFYVEPEFFEDFLWRRASSGATPGMALAARATGRRDFFVFGEGFGIDAPGQDAQSRKIEMYMHGPSGQRRMGGMLNFPLYGALGDVMARGAPTSVLAERVRQQVRLHPRLLWMPSFIDNHDVDRFLAGADERALLQALGALFTLPGIPVVYYGTEQGFMQARASMFATGWGSGGRDHFNPEHPLYRQIRAMADLRHAQAPLRRGRVQILAETADDAGALIWRREHDGQQVVVALNTGDEPVTVQGLSIGITAAGLVPVWGLDGPPAQSLVSDDRGLTTITLAPRSMMAWAGGVATGTTLSPPDRSETTAGSTILRASSRETAAWETRLERADPSGDDHGPHGRYVYPLDAAYAARRPADIHHTRLQTRTENGAQALQVTLTMADISTVWSPRNGFDHVAFTLFIELPHDRTGATEDRGSSLMPLQNGTLPDGMRWHRRLRSHGWSLSLFEPHGASADQEGRPLNRGVKVSTDPAARTITFTISAAALGRPASLSGARVWINTWDWDGTYRALQSQAADFSFGGGASDGVKWMDATDVLTLP